MDRPLVNQIIAAKKQYDEGDRPWLSRLADGQLQKIAASCGCEGGAKEPEAPVVSATAEPAVTPPAEPVVTAAAAPAAEPEKPLTAEEWIEKAPEHLQPVFADLLAQRRADEAALREKIVAQSAGKLTAEYLAPKKLDELQVLAAATRPAADYSGRGVQGHDPIASAGKPASAPRMPGIKIGPAAA